MKKICLTALLVMIISLAFAQGHDGYKPHSISRMPDTTCFSAKIDVFRKEAHEAYWEVKVYCKPCGEDNFKKFHFYKKELFAKLEEVLQFIQEQQTLCNTYQ